MAVVTVKIGGRDYQVACDAGQEEHLYTLASEVNDRINSLFFGSKKPPTEVMSLLMASLMLADELAESKKETEYFLQHPPEESAGHIQKLENDVAGEFEAIAQRIEKIAADMEVS